MTRLHASRAVFCALVGLAVLQPPSLAGPAADQRGGGARTGVIRGRVEIRPIAAVPPQRPNVSDLGSPERREISGRPQFVLYLETAPRGAFDQAEPGRATLNQRDETFVPHVLAVTTGTVVDFPNSDKKYHNVFSLSRIARFDLGRYAAGRSKSVRFDKPGIVRVFCDIHSHMNAFILVFSHPFFAVTDEEGRYRIDGVPAGNFNVVAWSDRATFDPRPATVTDGAVTQLDFTPR